MWLWSKNSNAVSLLGEAARHRQKKGSATVSLEAWEARSDEADLHRAPYSTVTVLARLRGWSTSVPLWSATQ